MRKVDKMQEIQKFDCAINGGGMIGATCALSLAQLGLTVAIIEKNEPQPFSIEQPLDLRVSAISLASQQLLAQLGAWQQVSQWRNCPYQRLGVWEKSFAYTEFNAKEINQSHLGHIVENRLLQLSLWQELKKNKNITLFCPQSLKSFKQGNNVVELLLEESKLQVKLLIAADGANSKVRELANIGITGWDYQQSAMLINVKTQLPQQNITWQQFLPTGPMAMLPMPQATNESALADSKYQGVASLVWYHHRDEIARLNMLSNEQLSSEIMGVFPKRLGKIKVMNKGSFGLTRRHANQYQNRQILLLGDAAHTINPLAGQGVNLGFKDVKALQNVIAEAIGNGECWHNEAVLSRYEKARRADNLLMMSAMDSLYFSFSHPSSLIKSIRNTVLSLTNKIPFIKNKVLRHACGLD